MVLYCAKHICTKRLLSFDNSSAFDLGISLHSFISQMSSAQDDKDVHSWWFSFLYRKKLTASLTSHISYVTHLAAHPRQKVFDQVQGCFGLPYQGLHCCQDQPTAHTVMPVVATHLWSLSLLRLKPAAVGSVLKRLPAALPDKVTECGFSPGQIAGKSTQIVNV